MSDKTMDGNKLNEAAFRTALCEGYRLTFDWCGDEDNVRQWLTEYIVGRSKYELKYDARWAGAKCSVKLTSGPTGD